MDHETFFIHRATRFNRVVMKKYLILAIVVILSVICLFAHSCGADAVKKLIELGSCPKCSLSGADLRGAYLKRADLNGADLNGADLSGANLSEAYLANGNLS